MKRILLAVFMISGMISGCSHNHYNVSPDNFVPKVKVLGVIPIITDPDSEIKHPQKEQLIQIVTDMNRRHEQQFVRRLKATGSFYTVGLMDGDPQKIFSSLLFRREKRDDAAIQYHKYFLKNSELRDYIKRNNLDAIMLIVVNGLTRSDKIYSSNFLASSTNEYNFLTMSAQILDPNGTILWEYPNFRRRILSYHPMVNLQYPDFSEADANMTKKVNLKFKTLEGLQRAFNQKNKDLMLRETQESAIYGKQFDEMIDLLKYSSSDAKKDPDEPLEPIRPLEQPASRGDNRDVAPVAEQPKPLDQPKSAVQPAEPARPPVAEPAKPLENVVVPATGSTR